jgi:7-cyano-7-deazaguanine synthase
VSPTYVPFRNGTMLAAIAAYAQQWVNKFLDTLEKDKAHFDSPEDLAAIYYGAHSEDAANWAYPDCTPEFNGAMANAIYIGTYRQIRLVTPLQWLTKEEVVRLGTRLGVPWENTWSCYKGELHHCGVCPTCRSRRQAFTAAGVVDPTYYAPEEEKVA